MDFALIKEELAKKIEKDKIFINEPMSNYTTFRIGGNADVLVKANNVMDIMHTLDVVKKYSVPLTIIGNGSNVLVKDNGIRGIVLKNCIDNYEIIKENDENNNKNVNVVVDSGMLNGKLAAILLKNSIGGFEFAAGIPGTVGGGVSINAGAHGVEFKDIVEETIYIDLKDDNKIKVLNNEQHQFSYRDSIFQKKSCFILNTKLKLQYEDKEVIISRMEEYLNARKEKQPLEYPSAGSVFKRGEDYIAAKLIDECGLKGTAVGNAEVSTKHAGFIINKGNATAKDVLKLIEIVKETVFEKTGKELKLEVEILGE